MKSEVNYNNQTIVCNWCLQPSYIIWLHGHGQCSVCGINIDECCRGEYAQRTFNTPVEKEKEKTKDD